MDDEFYFSTFGTGGTGAGVIKGNKRSSFSFYLCDAGFVYDFDRLVDNAHRIEMRGDSIRKNRGKPNT